MPKRLYVDDLEDEDDITIYSRNNRELMLDDDELTSEEEGFMAGYEAAL